MRPIGQFDRFWKGIENLGASHHHHGPRALDPGEEPWPIEIVAARPIDPLPGDLQRLLRQVERKPG
jgi:hypothetical protein